MCKRGKVYKTFLINPGSHPVLQIFQKDYNFLVFCNVLRRERERVLFFVKIAQLSLIFRKKPSFTFDIFPTFLLLIYIHSLVKFIFSKHHLVCFSFKQKKETEAKLTLRKISKHTA